LADLVDFFKVALTAGLAENDFGAAMAGDW